MIIYIFGGNCLFGLPARSTTSPQKKSDSTFSRKMMLGSPESVEVVPYRSGLSFTPLGEPTNPKVGPTVLNGGGGVCRFEVHSHYFIFAIETYQPPKTNRKIRPPKICYLFWQVDPFIILPPFFGTKKKTAFTSGDELLEGEKPSGKSPVAQHGPGHSSAGYLRFMTSITSFATSRCTETGKPAGCSWRKWRQKVYDLKLKIKYMH